MIGVECPRELIFQIKLIICPDSVYIRLREYQPEHFHCFQLHQPFLLAELIPQTPGVLRANRHCDDEHEVRHVKHYRGHKLEASSVMSVSLATQRTRLVVCVPERAGHIECSNACLFLFNNQCFEPGLQKLSNRMIRWRVHPENCMSVLALMLLRHQRAPRLWCSTIQIQHNVPDPRGLSCGEIRISPSSLNQFRCINQTRRPELWHPNVSLSAGEHAHQVQQGTTWDLF